MDFLQGVKRRLLVEFGDSGSKREAEALRGTDGHGGQQSLGSRSERCNGFAE